MNIKLKCLLANIGITALMSQNSITVAEAIEEEGAKSIKRTFYKQEKNSKIGPIYACGNPNCVG